MKKTVIDELEKKITFEMEERYFDKFSHQARYLVDILPRLKLVGFYLQAQSAKV